MLSKITPLILTWNEDLNITRCLEKLSWAKQVVVIDSFSTDHTLDLIKKFSNVEVIQRRFDAHSNQWNYGLEQVATEWVLSLDADYVLSDELIQEIQSLNLITDGYFIPFRYCVSGKPLRATLLPPRLALFNKNKAAYIQDGHTQLLSLNGKKEQLKAFILHDDRKPFKRWWLAQQKYSFQEADKLMQVSFACLNAQDKLRKMIFFAPFLVFIYCLFWRGLILDGWRGVIYSAQRFLAELLLSFFLIQNFFRNL